MGHNNRFASIKVHRHSTDTALLMDFVHDMQYIIDIDLDNR